MPLDPLPGTAPAEPADADQTTEPPETELPEGDEPSPLPAETDEETPSDGEATPEGDASDADGAAPEEDDAASVAEGSEPVPEVRTDIEALPEPVRRMRRLLLDSALRGDLPGVARLAGVGETMTQLSLVQEGEDAETLLRQQAGDEEGLEALAILSEILEAPYVVLDEGTDDALFLWPWLAGVPLEGLTPEQKVSVYRLMTAGDFQQSQEFGTYVFFRTGISADGEWVFFLAGD